jgi:hypothetical protein
MIPEYTPEESKRIAQELIKHPKVLGAQDFLPGKIFLGSYIATHGELVHDKRPLVLLLKIGSKRCIGLNLHWIAYTYRIFLVKKILEANRDRVLHNKPLIVTLEMLKPLLKNKVYRHCLRTYNLRGFMKTGVLVEPENLLDMARLNNAIFSKPVKL